VCSGCGLEAASEQPFRCQRSGTDDGDHVVVRILTDSSLTIPLLGDTNPYLRYASLFYANHLGLNPQTYSQIVSKLDERIQILDGKGFQITPYVPAQELAGIAGHQGPLFIKNETDNVSGSHKARHLMGTMLYLLASEKIHAPSHRPSLAISSCGNAALGAAVIAKAADWPLQVFIPASADESVVEKLKVLDADIRVCRRDNTNESGDPCTVAFRAAVQAGAIPFSCQGSDNGLAIEGGMTLGYEMVTQFLDDPPDRVFIQAGGGALGSACIQAFREARNCGLLQRLPRIHAVQTMGCSPLVRAHERLSEIIANRLGLEKGLSPAKRAHMISKRFLHPEVQSALHEAVCHRSNYMWPWEDEPQSIAFGILDDETYDWYTFVSGMFESGGYPVVATEDTLKSANEMVRENTGIGACVTGTAGFAGLLTMGASPEGLGPESSVVLLTGSDRTPRPPKGEMT
jgi:threonine synthase